MSGPHLARQLLDTMKRLSDDNPSALLLEFLGDDPELLQEWVEYCDSTLPRFLTFLPKDKFQRFLRAYERHCIE